jgi:hypothetical protein
MKVGSTYEVELVDTDGRPLPVPNVFVDVVVYAGGHPRYRFEAGKTDRRGHFSTSYEALERQRELNRQLRATDFDTTLAECDDTIGLAVPTFDQLSMRLVASQRSFPEHADALEAQVQKSGNREFISVSVKKVAANGTRIAVQLPVERT